VQTLAFLTKTTSNKCRKRSIHALQVPTMYQNKYPNPKETPRDATPCLSKESALQLFPLRLIKRNLRRRLHALCILVESTISLVALFLHRRAVLHQFLRNGLASCFENVDESAGKVLLGFAEESDGAAVLACAAGTGMGC
jgi:hypothetical protein